VTTVGPTALTYILPLLSVTELTVAVLLFQPTTITFRLPALWAAVKGTATLVGDDCGTAELLWTYVMTGAANATDEQRQARTMNATNDEREL
jgi:hypothetical protein